MASAAANKQLAWRLALLALGMFAFGFLLSPLYDVFCQVTGLNGKVTRTGAVSQSLQVDEQRQVQVQFIAVNNEGMPWQFQPEHRQLTVKPGEQTLAHYVAFNPTDKAMVARAVPSVAPSEAARYLHKVNCFCFEAQALASAESQRMPLVLMIDPELPAHIDTVTLSYTLFDITSQMLNKTAARESVPPSRATL